MKVLKALIRFIVRFLPFILHMILWIFRLFIQYGLRYRSNVIYSNLISALGDTYSSKQLNDIRRSYYHVLIRYIKEILYKVGWKKDRMLKSIFLEDKDKWNNFFQSNNSTIVLASHSGNWELNLPLLPALVPFRVIAFYKPISNKFMDNLMLKLRSDYGLENYPIEQTARVMNRLKGEKCLYLFVADQSPLNMNGVYWNKFLNQDTPWLTGAEKLAIKYKLPVVYLEQIPREDENDMMYLLRFHLIATSGEVISDGEIFEKYSRLLENEIKLRPEYWLWSHRRWKRSHLKEVGML